MADEMNRAQLTKERVMKKGGKPNSGIKGGAGPCHRCTQPIGDPAKGIRALGKAWHQACFKCEYCNRQLKGEFATFSNHPHTPYHHECWEILTNLTCIKCGNNVDIADGVQVYGRNLHEHCFTCWECDKPITEDDFYFNDDKTAFYHKPCYAVAMKKEEPEPEPMAEIEAETEDTRPFEEVKEAENSADLCHSCKKKVTSKDGQIAMDLKWHINCFKCCMCDEPITNGEYDYEAGIDDVPYHEECFNQAMLQDCHGCKGKVLETEEGVMAYGKQFHRRCLKCESCNSVIEAHQECGYNDEKTKLYHKPCWYLVKKNKK